MALSLYRKYRPEVFEDVVGQEHVEKTLMNAIAEGSVAHAYLFCGPRGTGKTTSARLLAKALLCENGPTVSPDGTCPQCLEIAQGTHPDVNELDAASRTGVDNVREEIIGRVNFAPTRGRYKIYIIDEVHMLSTAAFNALLKTLEEPPDHVVFILCTTDPHKVPETIQSRCQRFDFRRFSIEEIVSYLKRICAGEGYTYEEEALEFIAAKSAGGMRDATTALEQVGVFTAGNITLDEASGMFGQIDAGALFEIAGYIARRDTGSCFTWVDQLVTKGVDLTQFARDLAAHVRDLYVTMLTGGDNGIVACTAAQLEQYRRQAAEFGGPARLSRALDICGRLVSELRNSPDARLSVEIAMTRLCRAESELSLEALAERIERLEQGGLSAGMPAPATIQQEAAVVSVQQTTQPDVANIESKAQRVAETNDVPDEADQRIEDNPPGPIEEAHANASAQIDQGGSAPMSTERLLAAILTVVKRDDVATGALLTGVSLAQDASGYHLLFPTGAEFAMKLAGSGDARNLIAGAFKEILGAPVNFDCRIGSFAGASGYTAPVPEVDAASVPSDDSYYEDLASSAPADVSTHATQDEQRGVIFEDYNSEPDFDAPVGASNSRPVDDETAANIADALSAFGKGVKVREIDDK